MRYTIGLILVGGVLMAGLARANSGLEGGHDAYAKQHYSKAMEEYRRAAEAGDRSAQEILGLMHLYGPLLYGPSVEQNLSVARLWLRRAAAQQSEVAQYLIERIDPLDPSIGRARASR